MIQSHLQIAKKIVTRADIILAGILMITAVLAFILISNPDNNSEVYIYQHNQLLHKFRLTVQRQIIEIEPGIVLEIKDKKVRLIKSSCQNQTCIKQGWTSNLPIVCVPNELIIVIKNSRKSKEPALITS